MFVDEFTVTQIWNYGNSKLRVRKQICDKFVEFVIFIFILWKRTEIWGSTAPYKAQSTFMYSV